MRLPAEQALSFCREEGINGICLYVRVSEALIAQRVFTVSLDGGEDASTGGAVLAFGPLIDSGSRIVQIRQGVGHPLRRGHLFFRRDPAKGTVAVGGEVRFVARGQVIVRP